MKPKRDILEEIIAYKRQVVKQQKIRMPAERLYPKVEQIMADGTMPVRSMKQALQQSDTGIIAEFKRKSPSKGWISPDASSAVVPISYYQNGAAAISILTDSWYFGGHINFLRTARQAPIECPLLRKDFIIDEYQVFHSREMGADAILLIASNLTHQQCRHLAHLAHQLKLETLLEIHTEAELDYVSNDIDMVGVNNRNLGTFHTDVQNSYNLAEQLPDNYTLVSESGISDPATVRELRQAGFNGFLIGETFMKTGDPGKALHNFIQQVRQQ